MNVLVILLAAATSIIAEPVILRYDTPLHYNYRYAVTPVVYPSVPVVRDVIKSTIPALAVKYSVPQIAGVKLQYHDQDIFGQARYGHEEPGQNHHAVQDAFGNKFGGFSYYSPDGSIVRTSYVADAAGYRTSSSNIQVDPYVGKILVESRRKRDLNPFSTFSTGDVRYTQQYPHAYQTTNVQPVVTKEGFLQRTPEVLEATKDHFARVADSRARIAALQRTSENYQGPNEHVQNTFSSNYHQTGLPDSSYQSYDYRYVQPDYQTRSGFPQETPETLSAKAKYYAELAVNKARGATLVEPFQQIQGPVPSITNTPVVPTPSYQQTNYRYNNQVPHAYPTTNLAPVVTKSGFIEETPEVLLAKANHFAQHAAAKARVLNN